MTILFALFLMCYLRTAHQLPAGASQSDQRSVGARHAKESAFEHLQSRLAKDIGAGRIALTSSPQSIRITLTGDAFFASGQAVLRDQAAIESVQKIAQVLIAIPNKVQIEGHADDVQPTATDNRSNWMLSCARSEEVLTLFHARFGIINSRLSIVGYADTVPRASNLTPLGRSRNRRVEIVVLQDRGNDTPQGSFSQ